MRLNISPKSLWFALAVAGIALSAISIFFLSVYLTGQVFSRLTASSAIGQNTLNPLDGWSVVNLRHADLGIQASLGLPVRLKIPKIHVDSAVEYVGLAEDGAMDVPKNRDDVGWFELAARPGDLGSAVIAGHFGIREGKGSAFDNLHKLRRGDVVSIEDDRGAAVSFVVREIRRYDPKAGAAEVFGSSDGKAHLNLVTCEGVWDDAENGYPKRLVVFTDKLEEHGEDMLDALILFGNRGLWSEF